ncbi:MAG: tRNA (guanosine(37)-N1)-methyltransferase TrmD [Candidatus Moranbacteria bacterium]|nr:tRNA (guanosine(37)-N1)-methyltransferase TrmD [Candidatus Moranbacteria bacterium]
MNFHIITIFPEIFDSYFSESIIGRAQKKSLINIKVYNLRDFSENKHKNIDDTPYGGGAGMVMNVKPIFKAINHIKNKIIFEGREVEKVRTILFAAKGKKYSQQDTVRFNDDFTDLIFICGRYEGVDERVAKYIADEEISIGEYVLTGGEIPAMVVVDSVSRLVPNVLGNKESLNEESFSFQNDLNNSDDVNFKKKLEYPQYTKPREFNGWKVPEILLSGDHGKIKKWRENNRF